MRLHKAPTPLSDLHLDLTRLKEASRFAHNTLVGYAYDWKAFCAWCEANSREALPSTSETVSLYLADQLRCGKRISTARRRNCAIAHYHRLAGLESPVTRDVTQMLDGAQRILAEKPRRMRALTVCELRSISAALALQASQKALRDRALLVLGFASALRRASIAALEVDDVEFCPQGLVLTVQREKQDQMGRGRLIGIPPGAHAETCPVGCLAAWMNVRGGKTGPLFPRIGKRAGEPMDGPCVFRVVKRSVKSIGLDPRHYGGHSLRAGFVTAAAEAGAGEYLIAAHTGHRNMSVLRSYFRRADLFRTNACAMIGL